MVFVHARKETVKTAQTLREAVLAEGSWDDFDPAGHPMFDAFRREISTSRNKEMKQLFDSGFGIHHAGMLRSDRNMMEKMFEARAIKVTKFLGFRFRFLMVEVGPMLYSDTRLGCQSSRSCWCVTKSS